MQQHLTSTKKCKIEKCFFFQSKMTTPATHRQLQNVNTHAFEFCIVDILQT